MSNLQYHGIYQIEGLETGNTNIELTSSSNNNYTSKKKMINVNVDIPEPIDINTLSIDSMTVDNFSISKEESDDLFNGYPYGGNISIKYKEYQYSKSLSNHSSYKMYGIADYNNSDIKDRDLFIKVYKYLKLYCKYYDYIFYSYKYLSFVKMYNTVEKIYGGFGTVDLETGQRTMLYIDGVYKDSENVSDFCAGSHCLSDLYSPLNKDYCIIALIAEQYI